jgi:hypothetical protein
MGTGSEKTTEMLQRITKGIQDPKLPEKVADPADPTSSLLTERKLEVLHK